MRGRSARHEEARPAPHAAPAAPLPARAARQAMEERLRFAPVQVIGTECIMCAKLVGVGATVLVHAKVGLSNGTAIEVTVRTKDNRLADSVQRLCTSVLTS